ncbi:cyclopropane-fatty-acyl-phospholipid synthase [Amylibacter kogurei]|uniref:Cyclopropane-fatty-acyl-phospholipid synthase n=1 Tax=Paramylibacter kogurei TaxID=1889778 RepID=A0A2G5K8Z2_9RHOB|nr:FAD-dependent oxidoreductase [Amylibacter kogurei]PIB25609.1 cyclopropane-fatty-acyl-phospholipid synthase [Amylibacter kogurei]
MLDQTQGRRRKIAVVGGGISGLSAAYYLSAQHDITLFESADRLGGHARTVLAGKNGDQPVDTGFIVFNHVTYPHLTKLFRELEVPTIKSEMSFGASIDDGRLEYGLNSLRAIVAQKRNLLRPKFYKMIWDILRFGKLAESAATDDDKTIGDLVDELKLGRWFRDDYLMPMCGAIWSTPVDDVDAFPAKSLVRFFKNHALLAYGGQHQWWTVKGGSIEYVKRLEAALIARGCDLRLKSPVTNIAREGGRVIVQSRTTQESFDEIIFACHSDQVLNILKNGATATERRALGAIRYQPNRAVLHCDTGQMPNRRASWTSWVFKSQQKSICVTYWMNSLQNIPNDDPLFVTLNPPGDIPNDKIYDSAEFSHPIFDRAALRAQKTLAGIQGENNTWFIGAYHRHGFHEDGIASAMRIVRKLNAPEFTKGLSHEIDRQSVEDRVSCDL